MYFGPVIKRFDVGYNDGLNGYTEHPLLSRDQNYQDGFRQGREMRQSPNKSIGAIVLSWFLVIGTLTNCIVVVLLITMFFYWVFATTLK